MNKIFEGKTYLNTLFILQIEKQRITLWLLQLFNLTETKLRIPFFFYFIWYKNENISRQV